MAVLLIYAYWKKAELTDCMLTFIENENIRKKYKDRSLAKSSEYEIYFVINKKTNQILENLI